MAVIHQTVMADLIGHGHYEETVVWWICLWLDICPLVSLGWISMARQGV